MFKVKELGYSYPGTDKPVLKQISFDINPGEFLLVMGRSGSGKSTLARALCRLVPDFYGGQVDGQVLYRGRELRDWDSRGLSSNIAMLFQEAGRQIIYNQVERDIAFGLENQGIDPNLMKRRVAEVLDFFDLNHIRHKNPAELSGGEQRRVALAGVLVMQPRVLILDEPLSQLDPQAADEMLNWLGKLNAELGTTIILVEQRLDKAFPLVDRILLLEEGRLIFDGLPSQQPVWAQQGDYPLMPTIPYIMSELEASQLPLTVKEGRGIIQQRLNTSSAVELFADAVSPGPVSEGSLSRAGTAFLHAIWGSHRNQAEEKVPLLEVNGVHFSYSRSVDFFENLNIKINRGESVVILGTNGAGKTSLLRLITGLLQPRRGRITLDSGLQRERQEQCAYLPQSVEDFFLRDTVADEIMLSLGGKEKDHVPWLRRLGLEKVAKCDPRKLSVGEKQRVALACLLASDRQLLLLDEPTTGVDFEWRGKIAECLHDTCSRGKTVITITHDMEFASETASRVLFMHAGRIISDGPAATAFSDNLFYASQALHLFREYDNTIYKPSQARTRMALLVKRAEDGEAFEG